MFKREIYKVDLAVKNKYGKQNLSSDGTSWQRADW